jgi:hypothetical protein
MSTAEGAGRARRARGRGPAVIAVVMAGILGVLAMPASPASAIPVIREPIFDEEDFPEVWERPRNGFEWAVPSRFGTRVNGMVDYHWNQATATYAPDWVRPTSLQASFRGCPTEAEEEADGATALDYRWEVRDAADDRNVIFGETVPRCTWSRSFNLNPQTGAATPVFVRLSIIERATGRPWSGYATGKTFDQQLVAPKDVLIVSLGDSYGSGEGNPDIPQRIDSLGFVESEAQWVDKRCHRSANAAPAQAALNIEYSDPHNTVTFLSFACSGATISKEYWADQSALDPYRETDVFGNPLKKPTGTGILQPYIGAEHAFSSEEEYQNPANKLPSQIDQLEFALTNGGSAPKRNVDALLLSGGGNDMGFGPLAAVCTLYWECPRHEVTQAGGGGKIPLAARFDQSVAEMPARYQALASQLSSRFTIGKTYITEYPDPSTNSDGSLCSAILDDVTPWWMQVLLPLVALADWNNPPLIPYQMDRADGTPGKDELAFAAGPVMNGINGAVIAAAQAHSWTLVDGIADDQGNLFRGHGYCASDNWIRRAPEATAMQGPWDHPVACNPATFVAMTYVFGPIEAAALFIAAGCHLPPATALTKGTLHPTTAGHAAIAKRMLTKMKPDLIPNPPASPPEFSDNRAQARLGANGWLIGKGEGQSCPTGISQCVPVEVTVFPGTGADGELEAVSILRNGNPVSCSLAGVTAGGVTCKKQRSPGDYKWTLSFSADGIYHLEFAAQAKSGAVTTFSQEYKVDLTNPPTATATLNPAAPVSGGWYRDPVEVTFTGQDTPGGSGIDAVQYTLNGGAPVVIQDGDKITVGAEGVHTLAFRPIDLAGRLGPEQAPLVVRIDRTAPVVACGAADGAWHATDASVGCTATDGGSGVSGPTSFNLMTSVPAGTETAAAQTGSQQVCDVAGNCATAGPVGGNQVDKRPPSITVTRPSGSYYVGQSVTAAYSCADGGAGVAAGSCTGTVADGVALDTASLGTKQFTVDAADTVGNAAREVVSYDVTRHITSLTYLGDSSGDYHDPVNVAARLLDESLSPAAAVAGQSVTFALGGVSCTATTDGDGRAACTLVPDQAAGPATLQVSSPQTDVYEAASLGVPFTVEREQVTVTYTGPTVVPNGRAATLSAVVREEDVVAVEGRSVVFTVGQGPSAQSCTGVTAATGVASCTIPNVAQPLGPGVVTAAFAGDGFYEPASAEAATLLFGFLASGAFMVGPESASVGARATVTGPQWSQDNPLPGETSASFKGFASGSDPAPACGAGWTADPAASGSPPSSIPAYVGVVVTRDAAKSGNTIAGTASGIVVVRMDAGGAQTGTVVATYRAC